MLEHWLEPIAKQELKNLSSISPIALGNRIRIHEESAGIPDLRTAQIVLIGIGSQDMNAVRQALYALAFPFTSLDIVDLGNVRKQEVAFMVPLLNELLQGGILPVLIGFSEIFTLAQFQAYRFQKKLINLVVIDEKIRLNLHPNLPTEVLDSILPDDMLYNCSVIGYQTHFAEPAVLEVFESRHFEILRLGKAKTQLEESEPIIRDADIVSLNVAALKQLEMPAQIEASPNGFFSEEACQLARYAGMSDKLSSFGVFGFHESLDRDKQSAQTVAQIIWYFLEGVANRKNDIPSGDLAAQMTRYVVDIKEFDYRIAFWRSNKSGRWWMEIPMKLRKKFERHRLISCSHADYLAACNDTIPERLLNAFHRFS
jgi:formiminoglutamase